MSGLLPGDHYDEPMETDDNTNTWEQPMERTWETLHGKDTGEHMKMAEKQAQLDRKKSLTTEHKSAARVEKGIIRYVYVILDFSSAMSTTDLKPSRREAVLTLMDLFVKEYFNQNPISELGFITTHSKRGEKITELSGNPLEQVKKLQDDSLKHGGDVSLQNALQIAMKALALIPPYGSREVLIVMGSLVTCDPSDIHDTIEELANLNITCSVIGLAAEMRVCKMLAERTKGTCQTATDKLHLKNLLLGHVPPRALPAPSGGKRPAKRWIRMGFPQRHADKFPSLCACHLEFGHAGYLCPKCKTKFCEVPTDCRVCSIKLVSSPHLARSYHHLFPVPPYEDVDKNPPESVSANNTAPGWAEQCSSCLRQLEEGRDLRLECPRCTRRFCIDCDEYIHNSLHNCPGCLSLRPSHAHTAAIAAT